MITIKKDGMKFEFQKNSFVTSQDTPDGMYFKFKDGTELIIHAAKNPQFKTLPHMLMRSTADYILIDFDNPNALISFKDETIPASDAPAPEGG